MSRTINHALLLPIEAADELRCSPRTLARWRAEGTGPRYSKVGSRILYPRIAVDEWINKTLVQPVREGTQGCQDAPQRKRGAHLAPCPALEGGPCSTPLQKYAGSR